MKNKGDRKAQRKRRRERLRQRPPKQSIRVQLIDGNWSFYPVGYCKCHGGHLTQGLIDTHRCDKRECIGFEKVMEDE